MAENRQQERQRQRSLKKFEQRKTFTKEELESSNELSYRFGLAFTLTAAKDVLGLGEKRLERIRQEILKYEKKHFVEMEEFHGMDILERKDT